MRIGDGVGDALEDLEVAVEVQATELRGTQKDVGPAEPAIEGDRQIAAGVDM